MQKHKPNGFGVASLVLGIISIVFCWIPIMGLIAGILGIVFYNQQKKSYPNGLATGGLVTGIIGVVFSVMWWMFWTLAYL